MTISHAYRIDQNVEWKWCADAAAAVKAQLVILNASQTIISQRSETPI